MNIDDVIKSVERAHRVPPRGEGSRELLEEVMATQRGARPVVGCRRAYLRPIRRWPIALSVTAGLAAAVMAVSWLLPAALGLGPRPAAAALDIEQRDGYYVIKVNDLFAAPERYQAQLRASGLDIRLRLMPASPSVEGSILADDQRNIGLSNEEIARRKDLISPIQPPGGCVDRIECPIGVKVPVDFEGRADIVLGRKARPGELYKQMGRLDVNGEPLHCVAYVNKTVTQVRELLRQRGLTIGKIVDASMHRERSSTPGSWYVHEGWPLSPGTAQLAAGPTRAAHAPPLGADCPKHR
jgi:hypothetical protein